MKALYNVLNISSGKFDDGRRWGKVTCHSDDIESTDMLSGVHVHTMPIPSERVESIEKALRGNLPAKVELTLGLTIRQKQTTPSIMNAEILGQAKSQPKASPLA